MKVNIKNLILYIVGIMLFHSTIVNYYYVTNYKLFSILFGIVVFLYISTKIKCIFISKYNKLNYSIIVFSILAIISSLMNSFYNIDGTLFFILKFINLFFFFEYANERNKTKEVAKLYFFLLLFYNLVTLYMITNIPYLAYSHNYNYPFYSSKFTLSYSSMVMCSLFYFVYNKEVKKYAVFKLFGLLLLSISIYSINLVGCMTGVIGMILFIFLLAFPFQKLKSFMANTKSVFSIIILSSFMLILFYDVLIKIPIIENLIVNVLDKSLTLSGRSVVYEKILDYILSLKGLTFGYAYDGVVRVFKNIMYISYNYYALNAQNALFEIWMYFGLIGTIIFLLIVAKIYEGNNKNLAYFHSVIIIAFILIFLGMVEITYSFPLFLALAIINVEKKNEKSVEIEEYRNDKKIVRKE